MGKKVLFDEVVGRKAFKLEKMKFKKKTIMLNIAFIICIITLLVYMYPYYYSMRNFLENLDKIAILVFMLASAYGLALFQMSMWTRMRILEDGIEIEYIFRTKFIHKDRITKFLINSRKGVIVIMLKNGRKVRVHRGKYTIRIYFLWRKDELVDALNSLGVDYEIL